MLAQDRQFDRRQHHNRQPSVARIHFGTQSLIARDKYFDVTFFGCAQEFAVLEPGPAAIRNRVDIVPTGQQAQPVVEVLVNQTLTESVVCGANERTRLDVESELQTAKGSLPLAHR